MLQGVVKGHNVKRQMINAMKYCMQLLVHVQTEIQSRRIQMLESHAMQRQMNDKDLESGNGRWNLSHLSDNGNADDCDDSRLTKEEIDVRTSRKFEAIMKRERAHHCLRVLFWNVVTVIRKCPLVNHDS